VGFVHFFKEDGTRWTVPSNFSNFNRLDFELAPLQTMTAVISGQFTEIQSGWALAVGGGPFAVSSAYQYTVDSLPAATAAVIPARSDLLSILPAVLDTGAGIDTGVALVNPTDTASDATLKLMDGQGQAVGTRTVHLPAKCKFTAFLSNPLLFPGIPALDGYVQVDSLIPVAAMGLRTEGALFTSLPAVHDVLPWSNSRTIFVNPLLGNDGFNDGSLAKPTDHPDGPARGDAAPPSTCCPDCTAPPRARRSPSSWPTACWCGERTPTASASWAGAPPPATRCTAPSPGSTRA
jgi:hypothetical protein